MTDTIQHLFSGVNVVPIVNALRLHPELWNQHPHRAEHPDSPHWGISDIWLRLNDYANWNGDMAAFNNEHTSVWYPSADLIPVKDICYDLMTTLRGDRLGAVLLTCIPPGGQCKPHIDGGWHAGHYRKFGVQLQGNLKQAFHVEDDAFSAVAGDVYEFDNSKLHWIANDSDEPRMTLIVCIKTETRSTLCQQDGYQQ